MIPDRSSGPKVRPTLPQILLFVAAVGVLLLAGSPFSNGPQWAISAVSLLIGAVGFALLIAVFDARLRRRGKNGFWLILFFGPTFAGAKLLELVPDGREEIQIIALLVVCIIAAPFAIWGAAELSARD